MNTHEVFRRQKIAEEVVGKLQDAVKQRAAESDKKSSHLPNETRAIVRVYNGLLLWLCEGYSDEILWFYQYGSIPCWQRMSMFDRDVNTAIILLKDKNKAALAADIESRWQNIIQTAKKTDETLSELRERYNHDEDNPAYTNDVKSALFDIKTYASQLGESLFEVAKQQTTKTEKPAETEQQKQADAEKTVIEVLRNYESENGNKKGMPLAELEQETERSWIELLSVLNSLGKKQLIEIHKGEGYVPYWLPVELDESPQLRGINANVWRFRLTSAGYELLKRETAQKPAETGQNTTPTTWRRMWNWLRNHPHSYGLIGGLIFLILFLVLGLFIAQWRYWCWRTAGLAFLVLVLSLLGGRSLR